MSAKQALGAEADFRRAVQAEPRNPRWRVYLAFVLRKRGDLGGAEKEYREALKLNPRTKVHFALARILFDEKRYEQAEEELQASVAQHAPDTGGVQEDLRKEIQQR